MPDLETPSVETLSSLTPNVTPTPTPTPNVTLTPTPTPTLTPTLTEPTSRFDQLLQDFPTIYGAAVVEEPFASTGFACGEGWYDLLRTLSEELMAETDVRPRFRVTEIASCSGALRFFVNSPSDLVCELIDDAEAVSLTVCEGCGKAGRRRQRGGVLRTSCETCLFR